MTATIRNITRRTVPDPEPPPPASADSAHAAQTVRMARRYAAYCRIQQMAIDDRDYELCKAWLLRLTLTPDEYERACLAVAEALGL